MKKFVDDHNATESTYTLKCNKFCDWSEEELATLIQKSEKPKGAPPAQPRHSSPSNKKYSAASIDWRSYGTVNYVSPVKD